MSKFDRRMLQVLTVGAALTILAVLLVFVWTMLDIRNDQAALRQQTRRATRRILTGQENRLERSLKIASKNAHRDRVQIASNQKDLLLSLRELLLQLGLDPSRIPPPSSSGLGNDGRPQGNRSPPSRDHRKPRPSPGPRPSPSHLACVTVGEQRVCVNRP